jgi:hypothetical protein
LIPRSPPPCHFKQDSAVRITSQSSRAFYRMFDKSINQINQSIKIKSSHLPKFWHHRAEYFESCMLTSGLCVDFYKDKRAQFKWLKNT